MDDRDRYTVSGPDPEGQITRLRTSDGVHFTRREAASSPIFADIELKRLMGTATPTVTEQAATAAVTPVQPQRCRRCAPGWRGGGPSDTAAIDRQITAMLPSLPEPREFRPCREARSGAVVPLSRSETSPGGALLSGRPTMATHSGPWSAPPEGKRPGTATRPGGRLPLAAGLNARRVGAQRGRTLAPISASSMERAA